MALPIPRELMTLDEWAALPEDDSAHYELQEKAFEDAEAGIPHYWVVDLDPPAPATTSFALGAPGEGCVESQTASGVLVVTEPMKLRIDVDALVDRHPNPSEG